MSVGQLSIFDAPKVAGLRRSDPTSAKDAARVTTTTRAEQWKVLLRRLHDGPISADTGGTLLGVHRSTASSRLGVMTKRGLVEPAGLHVEAPSDGGRERQVLRYRLTPAGEREFQRMFGGWS